MLAPALALALIYVENRVLAPPLALVMPSTGFCGPLKYDFEQEVEEPVYFHAYGLCELLHALLRPYQLERLGPLLRCAQRQVAVPLKHQQTASCRLCHHPRQASAYAPELVAVPQT